MRMRIREEGKGFKEGFQKFVVNFRVHVIMLEVVFVISGEGIILWSYGGSKKYLYSVCNASKAIVDRL